jgi:hypothetical protein
MYSIDNECLVCIPYQFGTSRGVRAENRSKAHERGSDADELAPGEAVLADLVPGSRAQRADSSAVISLTADLASPKSIEVLGSK